MSRLQRRKLQRELQRELERKDLMSSSSDTCCNDTRRFWVCWLCTFHNRNMDFLQCEMCHFRRRTY
jgi:hypothetical protein